MQVFNRKRIKVLIVFVPVLYAVVYITLNLSDSCKEAKKFIKANEKVIEAIGPVNSVMVAFFGPARSSRLKANYELNVRGENGAGEVQVRLIRDSEGWKILSANLITSDNRVVVLKESSENKK